MSPAARKEAWHKMNPANNQKSILIIIYISKQKLYFLSGKSSMDVEIYIFSAFPVFNEPHLCPKVNLGSSHFAKSSTHRQFFLEIALEKNSY